MTDVIEKFYIGVIDRKTEIKTNHPNLPKIVRNGRGSDFYSLYAAEGFKARLFGSTRFEIRKRP